MALKGISSQSVRFLINTHWHQDHTSGNENFGKGGSVIIAHENVRTRMTKGQFIKALGKKVAPFSDGALPILTFSEQMTFYFNDDQISVFHVKNAHTDGDAIIYFHKANVLHMGDIYFNLGSLPFIDVNDGGSVDGILEAVSDVLTKIDANTQVIPGHGAMSNKSGLSRYHKLVSRAKTLVLEAMQGNKSEQEVIAARPLGSLNLTYSDWLPEERVTKLFFQSLAGKPQVH